MSIQWDQNCAVRERTADGISVGRCWFSLDLVDGRWLCPRHGNVTEVQTVFHNTGNLSEDPRYPNAGTTQ